jgi:hypothetical protein
LTPKRTRGGAPRRTLTRRAITQVMVTHGKNKTVAHEQCGLRLAGLALGLRGPGQVALVGHVAVCGACTADLEDLVAVADTLSLLAPEADPPSGFVQRVLVGARAQSLH